VCGQSVHREFFDAGLAFTVQQLVASAPDLDHGLKSQLLFHVLSLVSILAQVV
jgi:hypothetical protein